MGIAFRDLRQGCYYKGYDAGPPNGKKCFFYVEDIRFGSTCIVQFQIILRRTAGSFWATFPMTGKMGESSLCKTEVTVSDVTAEGLPLPPKSLPIPPASAPANPLRKFLISEDEEKAQKEKARMERNKCKSIVHGNAYSPRCLRCGRPNKQIPMMSMYWCPECEPE